MSHVIEIRKKLTDAKKLLRKAQHKHVSEARKQKKHLDLAQQHNRPWCSPTARRFGSSRRA